MMSEPRCQRWVMIWMCNVTHRSSMVWGWCLTFQILISGYFLVDFFSNFNLGKCVCQRWLMMWMWNLCDFTIRTIYYCSGEYASGMMLVSIKKMPFIMLMLQCDWLLTEKHMYTQNIIDVFKRLQDQMVDILIIVMADAIAQ